MKFSPNPLQHPIKMFSLGVVLAVASAFALPSFAQTSGQPTGGGMHGGRHGPGQGGMLQLSERMLDQVNATAEQRAQIKQIMQTAATDMKAQRDGGRALRDQMMQLFTQPTVDARAAETLRQQMLAQHDQASKRTMQAMLDTSRVLTLEQRLKLADSLKQRRDMMERHQRERGALDAPKS
jgi:periplasmic protein CpxP/Spy